MSPRLVAALAAVLVFLLPSCASAPTPPAASVDFTADGCGPVITTTVRGVPVPGTRLVADVTTAIRTTCVEGAEAGGASR